MARYIKVEDVIKVADYVCGEFRGLFGRMKERLEALQTADVVERKKLTEEMRRNCVECALYKDDHECKACAWGDAINVIENALTEERERDDKSD